MEIILWVSLTKDEVKTRFEKENAPSLAELILQNIMIERPQ